MKAKYKRLEFNAQTTSAGPSSGFILKDINKPIS